MRNNKVRYILILILAGSSMLWHMDAAYAKKDTKKVEISQSIDRIMEGKNEGDYLLSISPNKKVSPDDIRVYLLIRDREKNLISTELELEEFLVTGTEDPKTIQLVFPKEMYERHIKSRSALEIVYRYDNDDIFGFVKVEVPFKQVKAIKKKQ